MRYKRIKQNGGFRKNSRSSQEDESKWQVSVVYGTQDLHSFMNQSRSEGLSDQQSTGPRLRFVSISEIVQEESKDPELEENKIIFEYECYDFCEEEQMTKAQKVDQKKADKKKKYQRVEILHSLGYSTTKIAEDSQVKKSKDNIKRWKSKIRQEGSIWRSEGSGRPKKLNNEPLLLVKCILPHPGDGGGCISRATEVLVANYWSKFR